MILRKAFLLGGIFLLATFMLVQLSWGCDDDDKWDRDHHDKWDCHRHGKPCQPPKIQSVDVALENKKIVIHGENFDNGATPPVASLGGNIELEIVTYTGSEIVAKLPAPEYIPDSDYRLVVSTCRDSECKDKYCKDHGPNCKCKYCKDHCSKCKNKHCKDNEYKCRCKDRYSLTIPGPSGTIGLKIESKTENLPMSESIPQRIEYEVMCGSGFGVTGGGFSCSNVDACIDGLSIIINGPLIQGNKGIGWHVIGTYVGGLAQFTIHAICAQGQ